MADSIICKCLIKMCVLGLFVYSEETNIKDILYYDGYGEATIVCNGSDIIKITDYELINHLTDCPGDTCDLTIEDRNYIEACNGNSTCLIPINEMSSCLKDKGFFSVSYTCQGTAFNCTFDDGTCGFYTDKSGWTIDSAGGNPYLYVYVQTNGFDKEVKSNRIARNKRQCLSLKYYIRYSQDYILVSRQYLNGTVIDRVELWSSSYVWYHTNIKIMDAGDFILVIGARGHYGGSSFGVDDVRITNTECGSSTDLEQIPHNQECNYVDVKILLDGCYSDYLSLSTVSFDPTKENCKDYLPEEATSVCWDSDHVTYCDAKMVVKQHPSCFNLNSLKIEYICTETTTDQIPHMLNKSDRAESTTDLTTHMLNDSDITDVRELAEANITNQSNSNNTDVSELTDENITYQINSNNTSLLVGVTIGILLVLVAIVCLVFILYRYRRRINKDRNETKRSDNQELDRQQTFPAHSINPLNLDVGTIHNADGYTNIVTASEQHEYQELSQQNVDHSHRSDNYASLDPDNIEKRVYDELASPTNTKRAIGNAEDYMNIVTASEHQEYLEPTNHNIRSNNYAVLDQQNIELRVYDELTPPNNT